MADRLILHIGATKTGTSAIQTALVRNRATLLANGILYPADNDSDEKAKAGRVTGGNGGLFRSLYNKYLNSPERALKNFEAELRHLVSGAGANALLFSHERTGGIEPELLSELKIVLSRHFDRVQIIYYVRHIVDHAISQYGEYVKRRKMKKSFNAFAPKYRARFKETIEKYESVFGCNDMQCVLYDDVRNNIFRDFLQRIGLPSELDYEEPERVNRSLTSDEIEVLRRVNRMGFSRGLVAPLVEDLTFHVKNPKHRHMSVSRAAIDAVAEANQGVIEYVNARLSGGAVLRVASDAILHRASETDESEQAELDPTIMRALLESGLRVFERRTGKLDQKRVGVVRESDSGLREIEVGQAALDPKAMMNLLASGLRAIDTHYNKPPRVVKPRKRDILKSKTENNETDLKAAELLARKRRMRIERKKEKAAAATASDAFAQTLWKICRRSLDRIFAARPSLLKCLAIFMAFGAVSFPLSHFQERPSGVESGYKRFPPAVLPALPGIDSHRPPVRSRADLSRVEAVANPVRKPRLDKVWLKLGFAETQPKPAPLLELTP